MIPTNQNATSFINFLNSTTNQLFHSPTDQIIPGPPFLFGAILVLLAIMVMAFIPELVQFPPSNGAYNESYISSASYKSSISRIMSPTRLSARSLQSNKNNYYYKNMQHQTNNDNQCSMGPSELMNESKLINVVDDGDIDDDPDNYNRIYNEPLFICLLNFIFLQI